MCRASVSLTLSITIAVQWMLDMGVSLFRQGGSFACGNY